MPKELRIGLALSGGGSRAIAFHLGCLRALHDRGVLSKISVLSAVSGGSIIAALYAYSHDSFPEFEKRVLKILRSGLVWGIARQTFLSFEAPKILIAIISSGLIAALGAILRIIMSFLGLFKIDGATIQAFSMRMSAVFPRFASRSTAFERHLRKHIFGNQRVNEVGRSNLDVVLNATELRTGSAFRYGSRESGSWRYGRLVETPTVAKAVAASAAFPALLPSFDEHLVFDLNGKQAKHRVMITDGGVYDNLGISCLLPGRSATFSTNAFQIDFIIACDAGNGMPSGNTKPYLWGSRMLSTVNTIHRRTHTLSYDLLHRLAANGEIKGFLLPYMGQIDERLPYRPPNLVPRGKTFDYPTNFSPMSETNIQSLSQRGEQLTRLLLDFYAPHI